MVKRAFRYPEIGRFDPRYPGLYVVPGQDTEPQVSPGGQASALQVWQLLSSIDDFGYKWII